MPQSLCRGADSDSLPNMEASSPPGLFPEPRSEPSLGNPHDIAFSMVKGDFVVSSRFRCFRSTNDLIEALMNIVTLGNGM